MTINSYKAVGFSYDPNDLKFGHQDNLQYFLERRRNQTLLQGALRLFNLQTQYARSSSLVNIFTVLHYRDSLVAIALSLALRCLQTRDVMYTELTTHANYYWQQYGANYWSSLPVFEDDPTFTPDKGFTGLAGSLAFLLYLHQDLGHGLYPIELLEKILEYVWTDLTLDPDLTPQAKQQGLFTLLSLSELPFDTYTRILTEFLVWPLEDIAPAFQGLAISARQQMLSVNDWYELKGRWILGEVSPELAPLLVGIQTVLNGHSELSNSYAVSPFDPEIIQTSWTASRQLLAPSGATLFYAALIVDALTQIARQITDLQAIHGMEFRAFLSDPTYAELRLAWANLHATAYDAGGVLGLFNTLYEAKGLTYRFYLAALQLLQSQPSLTATGPYRLHEFLI